ncbi:TIGR03619 family F420-dependent LLM class oxidoreductase [Nocardioides sp. Soil796]|uniref:TIGR03619 family F420-dependent LLM class oxidoreductase n=1 Tax=Nocardioides sp. Soil796 TaxID=1736412 RepID=UPI0007106534|nr:TIGR03619 family F420-dependent LLM class oxidoreductase [Nocardioides sp. Soil796]KRF10449.1 hypothetical protein ASH02_20305 [Nocardioides sp. Soil796]
MARDLESAGFESAWVGDHVAMPRTHTSRYPFSPTGEMPWPATEPWCDSVVAMASMAEATSTIRVGTGVMVAGLRNPVVLAKQLATIDVLSDGRLELGVGAGWLTEEFGIVGLDAMDRGRRLDEAVAMIRRCWEGAPDGFEGHFYSLPEGSLFYPVPLHDVPVIIGGVSERAYERVVRYGSGWMGTTNLKDLQRGAVEPISRIRQIATDHGRDPDEIAQLVRVHTGPSFDVDGLVAAIPLLRNAGVDELLVDIPWSGELDLARWYDRLSAVAG